MVGVDTRAAHPLLRAGQPGSLFFQSACRGKRLEDDGYECRYEHVKQGPLARAPLVPEAVRGERQHAAPFTPENHTFVQRNHPFGGYHPEKDVRLYRGHCTSDPQWGSRAKGGRAYEAPYFGCGDVSAVVGNGPTRHGPELGQPGQQLVGSG